VTKPEAIEKLIANFDGLWESTPLYAAWEEGSFPPGTDDGAEDDFWSSLEKLKKLYKPSSTDINEWCQVYLALTQAKTLSAS